MDQKIPRFEIVQDPIEATRNGMFGGPVDDHEVFVPGAMTYMIDGKPVTEEEFYRLAKELRLYEPLPSVRD